jgi:hypothetical protein
MMIAAGLMDRKITFQHLQIERTDSGASRDTWVDEITVKCRVITPSLSDRRTQLTNEVIITDMLTFQTRKIYAKHFNKYTVIKHRLKYFNPKSNTCRYYQIVSIDDETDDLFIMAQLIQDIK